MKWDKKGLIFNHKSFDLPWYAGNTMVPMPYLKDEKTLRIYITMCDEDTVGRIGYVDVNPQNPSEIIGYSKEPVLNIGEDGCFDDSGVITASIVEGDAGELLMYYSGYEKKVKVPYTIFSGLAISRDGGDSFTRYKKTPILDRTSPEECSSRAAPIVIKQDGTYKMWYTGDVKGGWIEDAHGKKMPIYSLKYFESQDGKSWPDEEGSSCMSFNSDDEHGLAKASVWCDAGQFKMIYSIRSLSKGYRLGYAVSDDGKAFTRMDDQVGIDVSETGWDNEMICFGSRIECAGKSYLFYCGNKYGLDGLGYAEEVKG